MTDTTPSSNPSPYLAPVATACIVAGLLIGAVALLKGGGLDYLDRTAEAEPDAVSQLHQNVLALALPTTFAGPRANFDSLALGSGGRQGAAILLAARCEHDEQWAETHDWLALDAAAHRQAALHREHRVEAAKLFAARGERRRPLLSDDKDKVIWGQLFPRQSERIIELGRSMAKGATNKTAAPPHESSGSTGTEFNLRPPSR